MKWYKLENFSNYRISDKGNIKNIKTGKLQKLYKLMGNQLTTILVDDNNVTRTVNCAKLLLKTKGIIDKNIENFLIQIFYKDGNCQHINLDNITYQILEQPKLSGRIKCKTVYLHDLTEKTYKEFKSLYQISKELNVPYVKLFSYLDK